MPYGNTVIIGKYLLCQMQNQSEIRNAGRYLANVSDGSITKYKIMSDGKSIL